MDDQFKQDLQHTVRGAINAYNIESDGDTEYLIYRIIADALTILSLFANQVSVEHLRIMPDFTVDGKPLYVYGKYGHLDNDEDV